MDESGLPEEAVAELGTPEMIEEVQMMWNESCQRMHREAERRQVVGCSVARTRRRKLDGSGVAVTWA